MDTIIVSEKDNESKEALTEINITEIKLHESETTENNIEIMPETEIANEPEKVEVEEIIETNNIVQNINIEEEPEAPIEEITTEFVKINADFAEKLLKFNKKNRPLNPAIVERYVFDMKNGRWIFNGDSIKLSKNGNLIDGQHRLQAVIKANASIDVLLVSGLPDEAFETLDCGKKRSLSDTVATAGYKNYTEIASVLRDYYFWIKYDYKYRCKSEFRLSNENGLKLYKKYQNEINEALKFTLKYKNSFLKMVLPISKITLVYLILVQIDKEEAELFVDKLMLGYSLEPDSPIYALRDLLTSKRRDEMRNRYESDYFIIDVVFKAWNLHRNMIKTSNLDFKKTIKYVTKPIGYIKKEFL